MFNAQIYHRLKMPIDSLALLKISKYLLFEMGEMTMVNWLLRAIIENFQFNSRIVLNEPHIGPKIEQHISEQR